ncbi:MAG TPA: hypothetical protein VJA17_02395 [Candidatus Omnitrophota bacterium]|nr:MAG: hypothetical protein A2Z88_08030 [Omnitrophica WOR_2 bacterium GWA2_47_8]HLD69591.1 hypothetical protein [Candidatus Omnitrophota bacterium]
MQTRQFNEVVFKHMVEFPSFDCVFCSTEEKTTGRTRLFLIFNNRSKVYQRNGLKGTWDEIQNEQHSDFIRTRFDLAVQENGIPRYTS